MAYPSTPVRDDTARADEAPVLNGGVWSTKMNGSHYDLDLVSGYLISHGDNGFGSRSIATTYGPNCEIWLEGHPDTTYEWIYRLYWRAANLGGSTLNAYRLDYLTYASWNLYKVESGVTTLIDSQSPAELDIMFGIRMVDDEITFYTGPAGSSVLAEVGTPVTDSTFTGSGKLGVATFGLYFGINTVGGGDYSTPGAPTNTTPPSITGSAITGSTLSRIAGTWTGSPDTITYQWQIEDAVGAGTYSDISGETGASYAIRDTDVGKNVKVRETATNAGGSASATSGAYGPVVSGIGGGVSFPSTPVREDGTGSDESPVSLGGVWGARLNNAGFSMQRLGNKIVSQNTADWGSQVISTVFNNDCEVFAGLTAGAAFGWDFYLWLCVNNENSGTRSGYRMHFSNDGLIELEKWLSDNSHSVVDDLTTDGFDDAEIGVRRIGNIFIPYIDGVGVGSFEDTSSPLTGSGKIGVESYGDAQGFTYVGGGSYSPPPSKHKIFFHYQETYNPPDMTQGGDPPPPPPGEGGEGDIKVWGMFGSASDPYMTAAQTNPTLQQQIREAYDAGLAYEGPSPAFDPRLSWFPNAFVYKDAHAIYNPGQAAFADAHPDWILKDAAGNRLFIPWGCGTTCPQWAADWGLPAWRSYYITTLVGNAMAKGYPAIFMDDFNISDYHINTGNNNGTIVNPIDPRTGATMTIENSNKYWTEFVEAVRANWPTKKICLNMVYFNANLAKEWWPRCFDACDYIYLERGFEDNIQGGSGRFGIRTHWTFTEAIHDHGANVIWASYASDVPRLERNAAGMLLANNGGDFIGGFTQPSGNIAGVPNFYYWNLGDAENDRHLDSGLWRRDFTDGLVLLNEPGNPTVTNYPLGGSYVDRNGNTITQITLAAAVGAVLQKA